MKPHPRIRKAIKWGGAAVTVLLVVLWIEAIREMLVTGGEPRPRGLWRWLDGSKVCGIPPLAAVVTTIVTLVAWTLDSDARRRERAHLCAKCGYDRTGILKDAKCPECGAAPASV